ncbi:hypothetical protein ACVINW_007048 [Bradyrhizobium sp. USDA 4461]
MKWIDKLLGRREGAVTVPVLDGPFLPNQKLELAPVLCEVDEVDNLVAIDAGLFASKGSELLRLQPASSGPERLAGFDAPISAMAGLGEALAIGLDGKGIVVRGAAASTARWCSRQATSCDARPRSHGWTSRRLRCATGRSGWARMTGDGH